MHWDDSSALGRRPLIDQSLVVTLASSLARFCAAPPIALALTNSEMSWKSNRLMTPVRPAKSSATRKRRHVSIHRDSQAAASHSICRQMSLTAIQFLESVIQLLDLFACDCKYTGDTEQSSPRVRGLTRAWPAAC